MRSLALLKFLKWTAIFAAELILCVAAQELYGEQAVYVTGLALGVAILFAIAFKNVRDAVIALIVPLAAVQLFLGLFFPAAAVGVYYPNEIFQIPLFSDKFVGLAKAIADYITGGKTYAPVYLSFVVPFALVVVAGILASLKKMFAKIEP